MVGGSNAKEERLKGVKKEGSLSEIGIFAAKSGATEEKWLCRQSATALLSVRSQPLFKSSILQSDFALGLIIELMIFQGNSSGKLY